MEILILLVESRPNLVTREQIIEKAWGRDVFVDSDNSINGAIRKIRAALRDDPDKPRFIRTVTGMGYRFIAPVAEDQERPAAAAPDPVVVEVSPPPAATPELAAAAAQSPSPPSPAPHPSKPQSAAAPRARIRGWAIPLVAVMLAGIAGVYLQWPHARTEAGRPGGRLMLAVLPFENMTGDAGQDYLSD